jgi:asparagine synthase (glutamine-hydrolysing)
MCGIFGEYVVKGSLTDENIFRSLNDLAEKRGPDHAGYWEETNRCRFGFRRLSILDLSPNGHQPMISGSGRWVIVFNGEIYNFAEIKAALPQGKYIYRGHSDTEVMLNAFEEWGVEATVKKLDGMFAIALYDKLSGDLYLVRDFAGIKPLFYGFNGSHVVFASQYDQVTRHPRFKDEPVKPEILKSYLQRHYMAAPHGIVNNTWQLRPGEILKIDTTGKLASFTYWTLPDPEIRYTEENGAIDFLAHTLNDSVKSEMIADVPVGTFLSGGIDSPLVTYYARENTSGKLKSFSIGSDSPVHDESRDASAYADLIGVDFHLQKMDAAAASSIINKVTSAIKEPFADFSIIPTYLVSKLAREDVTVALSGDGGDELFYGYERFWSIARNRRYSFIPKAARYAVYGADKLLFKNRHVNSNWLQGPGVAHQQLHSRFSEKAIFDIFPELGVVSAPTVDVYQYGNGEKEIDLLIAMQKAEFYDMMQKTLRKVDLASMAVSLEVRVPFLKKSFIEASLKVDPFLSYGFGKKKSILKKLLRANLPEAPVNETKKGFTIPLAKWIREELRSSFEERLLDSGFIHAFGIPDIKLEKMLRQHNSGQANHKWPLFTLYSLAAWHSSRT